LDCSVPRLVALLHDMGELVSQQPSPARRPRRKLTRAENYILPKRIGQRIHRLRRLGGLGVGMHLHMAEIATEAGFHECAGFGIEQPTRRPEDLVDNWWR
jgi:hypothetical protein